MAGTITYGTQLIPETTRPASPPLNLSDTRGAESLDYGKGILRPLRRDGGGDFDNTNTIALIRSEIGQTLGTLGSSPVSLGELPWRPEFGSLLYRLRFSNLDDTTVALAKTYVVAALSRWNSRVRVTEARVTPYLKERALRIVIRYTILAVQSRSPIALNETAEIKLRLS